MAEQAVFTVLQRGSSIAVDEAKYLLGVFNKLELAKQQLVSMQAFLTDLDEKMLRGGAMARNLVCEVREVAQEVEDIIDTANILRRQRDQKKSIRVAISKYACFPVYLAHLHKIVTRIDSATARMKIIFDDFQRHNIVTTAIGEDERCFTKEDEIIQHWRSSAHPDLGKQVDVIGFDHQIEQIKGDLVDTLNKQLSVFSILGPGGAGKSTMASKVYVLAAVSEHFKVRAWITVSQRFLLGDLLKEMVKRIMPVRQAKELNKKTQSEVKKRLHDFLQRRRYLIILDDVWEGDAWDVISDAFPDSKNGSRVILTTRKETVANHPYALKKIYRPKLLNGKESTRLLLRVALPEYILDSKSKKSAIKAGNLVDFKKVGKDLANKCCGLPLAVVVLGGHLSRNLDIAEWRRLTSSVDWHAMITTDTIIGAILDLSYYDMPSHLRSCFMYTTAFPEDTHIDVQLLSNLWVAEGFIPLVRGRTGKELAIMYVAELAQRCMIQVAKRTHSGMISLIKVHDVLRDWGIGRARREGLIKDCHNVEDIKADYSGEMMKCYRVVLHGFLGSKFDNSMGKLRTLLDFTLTSVNNNSIKASNTFGVLHHMRVLYLQGSAENVHLPKEIGRMRYLRYIGLGGSCCYHLPSSIGDLLNLETLDASGGKLYDIPHSLWKILTLRHVHVSWVKQWSVPQISSQSNVHVTVCYSAVIRDILLCTSHHKREMEATRRFLSEDKKPNLSYCFGMKYVAAYRFDQLEVVGRCNGENQCNNDLTNFGEWADVSSALKICCANLLSNEQKLLEFMWLRFLLVLEIGERSYTGSVINCPRGSFPKLLQLVLHDLAVEDWKIEDGCMISLMELILCKCSNLRYLPEGLSMLPRLKRVKLIAMSASCYQESRVARELDNKGCVVSVSTNEKDFKHLDMPIQAFLGPVSAEDRTSVVQPACRVHTPSSVEAGVDAQASHRSPDGHLCRSTAHTTSPLHGSCRRRHAKGLSTSVEGAATSTRGPAAAPRASGLCQEYYQIRPSINQI
ncbi:hypothetical protein QOZ80_7BG0584350 [Eleusine coracana subsp. coracana]|nr:hypothetical protein QOZ80_7BG0584350 [Eleusine coracana subsp. coracana]